MAPLVSASPMPTVLKTLPSAAWRGRRQVGRVDRLDDVGCRAPAQRRLDEVLAGRGGEHHDLRVGMAAADLVEAGQSVDVRHAHVEHHEVRLGARDERQYLHPVLRLADDLEAAVLLEGPACRVEHEALVVGDQNSHGPYLSTAFGPCSRPNLSGGAITPFSECSSSDGSYREFRRRETGIGRAARGLVGRRLDWMSPPGGRRPSTEACRPPCGSHE